MKARGAEAVHRVADQAVRNMNMPRNASKGGWAAVSRRRLFIMLLAEVWELGAALWKLSRLRAELRRNERAGLRCVGRLADRDRLRDTTRKACQAVRHEAGDVVAFVAMLVDHRI